MDNVVAADLDLALRIADAADRIALQRYLAADLAVETKSDLSPVTEADRGTEMAIREILTAERPTDGILGEEYGEQGENERRWIIDPIDGTANYLRGVPIWATLIGLESSGGLTVGVVSAPALARRWWAATGGGAWTRDPDGSERQIHVSDVAALNEASCSISNDPGWQQLGAMAAVQALRSNCWRVRDYGDFLPHMLVAEGAVDVVAEPELSTWDLAALIPIVSEAGGQLSGWRGGDAIQSGSAVTTNGTLHDVVLSMLTSKG
jgi:histidinol-phosphatase